MGPLPIYAVEVSSMCKSIILPLLAVLSIAVSPASSVWATETEPLPPQIPARTSSGATNINDVWLHSGGGRLYWNTLVTPRQIALEGARFVDPAAVPELALTPPADKKAPVRHARKAKTSNAGSAGATGSAPGSAPKGVGKTSLKSPASDASSIPPLSAAGATPAAASSGKAGTDSPYSSAAASTVGGVGGGAGAQGAAPSGSGMPGFGGQGAAGQGAAQAPAISADDILPRANARP